MNLIDNPLDEERNILSNFSYRENLAILHTDENIMPKNKDVWSSWNSFVDKNNTSKNSLSYWLNLLQNLKNERNIFLTLNPIKKISEDKILKKINFTHPYYDQKALDNLILTKEIYPLSKGNKVITKLENILNIDKI